MRTAALIAVVMSIGSGGVVGQPKDGDLIVTLIQPTSGHFIAYVDPSIPRTVTTLAATPTYVWSGWVQMGPNNTDLVVHQTGYCTRGGCSHWLTCLQRDGSPSTISQLPTGFGTFAGELDHDGYWILANSQQFGLRPTWYNNWLFGVDHGTGVHKTFYYAVSSINISATFTDVTIDRDFQAIPYVGVSPVFTANRSGSIDSLVKTPRSTIEADFDDASRRFATRDIGRGGVVR